MKKEKENKLITMQCPYGQSITFRRSAMGKKDWEYVVHKFGITTEPDHVLSISIVGEDDFGHIMIDVTVEG